MFTYFYTIHENDGHPDRRMDIETSDDSVDRLCAQHRTGENKYVHVRATGDTSC